MYINLDFMNSYIKKEKISFAPKIKMVSHID